MLAVTQTSVFFMQHARHASSDSLAYLGKGQLRIPKMIAEAHVIEVARDVQKHALEFGPREARKHGFDKKLKALVVNFSCGITAKPVEGLQVHKDIKSRQSHACLFRGPMPIKEFGPWGYVGMAGTANDWPSHGFA